ncbi:MAG: glycosyltransferase family 2 protein [Eubacteriales bacterium]|nr:glycosyltransferase family 2 protein [Eubacteriales bacterium]
MDDHIVILDTCDYTLKGNGTCILRGWMYVGEEEPQVQVRADHIPLECSMTRNARPDVLAAMPELQFPDENAGFEIRISNMEPVFSLAHSLRVRICCNGESLPVLKKDMDEVRDEYYSSTIRYYIETIERRFDNVHIQGWCISTYGKLETAFYDEKGNKIEGVRFTGVRRADLCEQFQVELKDCYGFIFDIPRNQIKGRKLRLSLGNKAVQKEKCFDMYRFDRENTRIGRILHTLRKENKEKNREILKEEGIRGFWDFLREESGTFTDSYGYYARKHEASPKELQRQAKEVFSEDILFSIVIPLYHTPVEFLRLLLDSVTAQSYGNWELCLADGSGDASLGTYIEEHYGKDKRIRYRRLEENLGIAGNTNGALDMAEGDFIVFADHDDVLAPDALYELMKELQRHPEAELLYTDEDLIDEDGNSLYPHFKPDFNLDYLRSINYICHLTAVKRSLFEKVGGLRSEFDGAQDYDFLLRCVEQTDKIRHIPRVLYHWRSHEDSTAGNQDSKQYAVDAGKKALDEHYQRLGLDAQAEFAGIFIMYRTRFKVQGSPKVSILIPNKDHTEDLETCISSVQEKSTWKNTEIIVIENNSELPETFAYYHSLEKRYPNVQVVRYQGEFNYSAINNFGASYASGDYILLLNNDTEVITPDWLEQMLGYCQREDVAIVGAKLFYPDDTVQHAGVVIGMGGFAGHILTGYGKNYTGYMGRLKAAQDISAVTGACLMVKKSVFDALLGLDEGFGVALNDVDFCLRARAMGKLVVFQPQAQLYHYESKSRGLETTPEKQERFQREIRRFQERYEKLLKEGDPYYNPNLSLIRGDCSLRKAHEGMKGRRNS